MTFLRAALVPCLFALAIAYCFVPNYFYVNGDPDFGYLMNSARIVEGMGAWHVDHPGSILQLLGAAVIVIVKTLKHDADGLHTLITRLNLIYLSTVATSAATLLGAQFILGWVMLRRRHSFLITMAAQLSPALFADIPHALLRINSETTLAACGLLVAAAFLPFLEPNKKKDHWHYVLFGCAIGASMVTKANVWPIALLALAPLFAAEKSVKAFLTVMASISFTFLVLTIPAWNRYPYLFTWMASLFTHDGIYGQGKELIVSFGGLRSGLEVYANFDIGRQQVVAIALALLLILGALRQRLRIYFPVLAAFLVIGFLILKHPAMRYAVAFVPVVAIAIFFLPRLPSSFRVSLASLLIFLAADGLMARSRTTRYINRENSRQNQALAKELNGPNAACAVVVMGWGGVPLPEAGFMYGQNGPSANFVWAERMKAYFPRYFEISPGWVDRYSKQMPLATWAVEASQFPCQIFIAPEAITEPAHFLRQNFKGAFQDTHSNNIPNRFRVYRHDGRLIPQHRDKELVWPY